MERLKYFDFDLLIEKNQNRYRARVLQSPAGQASAEFVLPFMPSEVVTAPNIVQVQFRRLQ